MSEPRPPIPAPMERDVLIEAGYRCAIPRCGAQTLEIHHIEPWAKVKEHTFNNLIALCPTCHARVTKGEIDRKAVRQIKANLSVFSGRYGDVEQRILRRFAANPEGNWIQLPIGFDLLVMYLVEDGQLALDTTYDDPRVGVFEGYVAYRLTPKGREFVNHWIAAEPL